MFNWIGESNKKDGKKMPRISRLQLEVETILVALSNSDGWESRSQADKIVELVTNTILGERVPTSPNPWEAMECKTLVDVNKIWEKING